jgi:hypothetical protein
MICLSDTLKNCLGLTPDMNKEMNYVFDGSTLASQPCPYDWITAPVRFAVGTIARIEYKSEWAGNKSK